MYLTERGLFPGYMPTPSTEHCAHVHNYTHIRDLTSFGALLFEEGEGGSMRPWTNAACGETA